VQTALAALGPGRPRREAVRHGDLDALETAVRGAIGQGARRVWYCADGIYSMFGDRLDVDGLVALMRRYEQLHVYLDDAHGMSWCGRRGAGSLADAPLPRERTVLVTSLGKGFGCMGGAIAVPDELTRQRIQNLGPALMFSIQLPPSVLGSIVACARIHLGDEIERMQDELHDRMLLARSLVHADPRLAHRVPCPGGGLTPINYIVLGDADQAIAATQKLLARGFLVNPVCFPVVPLGSGGVRFTVCRGHTPEDLRMLVRALGDVAEEVCVPAVPRPVASVVPSMVAEVGAMA
jgi:7-keto-8-aminopelargonate synthetase-like enzyme